MKPVLSSDIIRDWDSYTIKNEPILSIDLMERASKTFVSWFVNQLEAEDPKIIVIASKGNNGGDGLASARLLIDRAYDVDILIADIQPKSTKDFDTNLKRLKEKRIEFDFLVKDDPIPDFKQYDVVIDALFGSGLSRPISGYWAEIVETINNANVKIFSIDIPSGMYADKITDGIVVQAENCLTFEVPKLGMFLVDNSKYSKNWVSRSIGLKQNFIDGLTPDTFYIERQDIKSKLKPRNRFDHKGKYGHSLIIGGQKGMIGAAVLASKACLRTGSGLVSALIPDSGNTIMQISNPEVMTITGFGDNHISALPKLIKYSSIGIGVGLGKNRETVDALREFLENCSNSLVIDADALNIISENKQLLKKLPENTIITPHPGEFARLFGPTKNAFQRVELQRKKAKEYRIFIILKGAYTAIATPEGNLFFNSTGNPGMATAGAGDVLTGIITSLLSQGYSQLDSCIVGVYLHGLAGDIASEKSGQNSLIAGDIIHNIPNAFIRLKK